MESRAVPFREDVALSSSLPSRAAGGLGEAWRKEGFGMFALHAIVRFFVASLLLGLDSVSGWKWNLGMCPSRMPLRNA